MTAKHHANQWRLHDRVRLPVWVALNGERHEVQDWSFAGFSIQVEAHHFAVGDVLDAVLSLPFLHYTAQCELQAEVKLLRNEAVGFEFLRLSPAVRLLMREYVDEVIEGRLEPDIRFRSASDAASSETENARDVRARVEAELQAKSAQPVMHVVDTKFQWHLFQYVLLVALGLGFVYWVLSVQRYVVSIDAGIAGNTVEVRSRTEGLIQDILVKVGDRVEAGDLIVKLDDRDAVRALRAGGYVQQMAEDALRKTESALKGEHREAQMLSRVAGWRSKAERAKLSEADSLTAQAKLELERVEQLHQAGFVSKSVLDEKRLVYQQRVAVVGRVQADVSLSEEVAHEAAAGRFFTNVEFANRTTNLAQAVERQRAVHAQALLDIGPLLAAVERTSLTAQRDSVVRILHRAPGEWVNTGELVATLELPLPATVMAKFSVSDAERLGPGQTARVFLPAINQVLDAKVEAVGSPGGARAAPAGAVDLAPNTVPVTLAFLTPQNLPAGLRARVKVDTDMSVWMLIRNRLQ